MPDARDSDQRRRARDGLGTRAQRGASIARLSASTGAGYVASRLRGLRDGDDAEQRFHAETAEKLVELLGSMKGAAMKIGQIASFVDLDLPPEVQATYHEVLADLRADAPALDPALIADVVAAEYGAPPEDVFARWDDSALASASIGQVHRAALDDGTEVAVKVQYPGVAEAIEADLANVEAFAPLAKFVSPNLQVRPLLEELRDRLVDELDYQREATYQQAFYERYCAHPFIRVPRVFVEYCRPRVIVSEFVAGDTFGAMLEGADAEVLSRYGEILYRFVFGSLHRFRLFNGDPHPGNYLFPSDGTVAFLDFGSVKLFSSATRDELQAELDAVIAGDASRLVALLRDAGFLHEGQLVDADRLLGLFRLLNEPVLEDREYTYTPEFARRVIRATTDPREGYYDLLRKLNLPAHYLLLNRIQWGVNSILGRLRATANWHRIARELAGEAAPATELGRLEAPFLAGSTYLA
jgi:predicted unusual protein kinase regulating ubiquinone biosynthesis (AarF/ABC1/UbiB family)